MVGVGDFGQCFDHVEAEKGGVGCSLHNLGFRKRELYSRGQLIPLPYNSYAH